MCQPPCANPPLVAAAAPVAPLGAEDDEVVAANRLHLAPCLAAPAGGVERARVLYDHALVPGAERLVEDSLRFLLLRGKNAGDLELGREPVESGGALLQRRVEQVVAVDVQPVEQERR